jgi:hypothetical protein
LLADWMKSRAERGHSGSLRPPDDSGSRSTSVGLIVTSFGGDTDGVSHAGNKRTILAKLA